MPVLFLLMEFFYVHQLMQFLFFALCLETERKKTDK
ncbi:hypothetical protein Loa_01432 [Legionella oakridgensis ATCC 33761 = DSM 21215]|uniref:Uncharacterized protein n=1 Tax=Legionella oakridgensis ATCC 33761 = DSM 21215 TaxID=1268635 RepID=W0BAV5_9GAMM|nr:hypothetical protein Loa_01432 [Legionella oakridgensis ATCC 33761 = DSM 21215]ETO93346.1 hypothetical protein LOR_45c07490 [Legionella oakridgensis RV-2-2007]STY20087.1 Uncharacterised protein [Legionella longbeachae]